jgi:very-short-patch-repair endonuclease
VQRAKDLRRDMTAEERLLWSRLRANQVSGHHFRRQQIIDGFIVDFYCHSASLVIEVDGGVHQNQTAYDAERDTVLASRGLTIIRVTNDEVRRALAGVVARIAAACET